MRTETPAEFTLRYLAAEGALPDLELARLRDFLAPAGPVSPDHVATLLVFAVRFVAALDVAGERLLWQQMHAVRATMRTMRGEESAR